MNAAVRFVLVGTRASRARSRLVAALCDRSRTADRPASVTETADELADRHLEVLIDNDVVERRVDDGACALSDYAERDRAAIESVVRRTDRPVRSFDPRPRRTSDRVLANRSRPQRAARVGAAGDGLRHRPDPDAGGSSRVGGGGAESERDR